MRFDYMRTWRDALRGPTRSVEHVCAPEVAHASIAVLAARHKTRDVLTLDERHFRVLTVDGEPFRLLPGDG
jgi:hypothetical protein